MVQTGFLPILGDKRTRQLTLDQVVYASEIPDPRSGYANAER